MVIDQHQHCQRAVIKHDNYTGPNARSCTEQDTALYTVWALTFIKLGPSEVGLNGLASWYSKYGHGPAALIRTAESWLHPRPPANKNLHFHKITRWSDTLKHSRSTELVMPPPPHPLCGSQNALWRSKSKHSLLKILQWGLPWWCSGWESACQCREHGFEPWSGRIPRAAEQLGPCATTAEPARLEPVLRNKRGRDGERPAHRDEEWPPLAVTRESPRTETKTQHSQK